MVDFLLIGAGLVLVLLGVPAVVNHSFVDEFNRVVKSWGTRQTAADIEMSTVSIMIGRIAGLCITLYGIGLILGGL